MEIIKTATIGLEADRPMPHLVTLALGLGDTPFPLRRLSEK
jgi:hypothetical protein